MNAPNLRSLLGCLLGALTAATPGAATAEAGARTSVTTDLHGRVGPLGVMLQLGLERRWGVEDGESALLRGRYALLGASLGVSPASGKAAAFVEWVPVAVFQVRLQLDAFRYFGSYGSLLRFPSASSPFGQAQLDALSGSERTGFGRRILVSPVLRARIGPLLLRSQTDVAWYDIARSDGWYYESEYDTLLARDDLLVSSRLGALFVLWEGGGDTILLAGPAYEVTYARKAGISRQRAEGVLFWSPAAKLGGVSRPRLLGIVGVNLVDRNREGEPFATVGLGGELDL